MTITIRELQNRTETELKTMQNIALVKMSDFDHQTCEDRLSALILVENIRLVLGGR